MKDTQFLSTSRRSYDRISPIYAEANTFMPPAVLATAEQFCTYLPPDSRILDVGCGHGRESLWFRKRGYHVTAFDLSLGMLGQLPTSDIIPRIQGDMLELPFVNHSFMGLWCNAAILHIPKRLIQACLVGFRRVLMNKGKMCVTFQAGTGEVWETSSYGTPVPRFFARYTFSEAAHIIERAGFTILHQSESKQGERSHWLHYIAHRH